MQLDRFFIEMPENLGRWVKNEKIKNVINDIIKKPFSSVFQTRTAKIS